MDNFKNFSKSYLTKLIKSFSDDQLRDMKKDIARLLTVLNSKGSKNGK